MTREQFLTIRKEVIKTAKEHYRMVLSSSDVHIDGFIRKKLKDLGIPFRGTKALRKLMVTTAFEHREKLRYQANRKYQKYCYENKCSDPDDSIWEQMVGYLY